MTAEIEIKLAIDPGAAATAAATLFRHPAVAAIRRGRIRTARVVSTYFDTPDWRLAAAGIALRLRRDGTRWLQTVKGPPLAQAGGALHARGEYEWPLAGPRLDPVRLATTPWRRQLGDALASGRLASRFTTDFERQDAARRVSRRHARETVPGPGRDPRLRHVVARSAPAPARTHRRNRDRARVRNTARLFELAAALTAALPLAVATTNKAARGQALVLGHPDGWYRPVRAKAVALPVDVAAPEALRAIAVECLNHVAANATGLVRDDDPEWIHQMRVGTRRLRSCLGLVRALRRR